MATDLSQESVLQFIRSVGGSVKNSELVQHYRNFIRDHADRDRNRELFKKFVNTVATVQQLDGVSFVVLRRKYKGRVPPGDSGGGSPGPLRVPVGNNTEPSPERDRLSPSGRVEKTGQRAQQREVIKPAPAGETAETTILPAAGVILNNNNTVETNLNLKQVTRPPDRPAENTPSLSEAHAQEQLTRVGQPRLGPGPPPGVTPVVRPSQLVPQPLRGREVYLPPGGGLRQEPPLRHISHRSEEPPLHHVSHHLQEPPLHHISHRTEEPPLHHISHRTEEPPLHHVSRHPQEPPLHHISHRSQEPPHHVGRHPQDPPLHHISHRSQEPPPHHVIRYPQEVPLYHGSHRSQEPPLHHFSRHPQEPPLHHFSRHPQEPPFHHISRHPWEPPLHHTSHHFQEPPLHHISRYPQKPPLHHAGRHPQEPPLHHAGRHSQEPPLHHAGRHSQEPPLHHAGRHSQEPPLHHVSRQPQLALQSEGGLRQEPPLHHINLHQEPPLHHTSRYPEVALQPEGDLHPEPPLHYISLHPQEPVLHHASPHPQEPPLHHASHQPQLALQSEGGLHQEPPLHHISLHQEPPLHHTGRDPEVALQPEGDLHQEPPPHHTSRDPEVALQPDVDLQQGPPLHHASHHLQVALQPEESLHQDPPLHHTSHQPQVALQPEEGLHQDPPLHQTSHQPQVVLQPEEGLHQEPPPPHTSLQVAPRRVRHRQSYKSAVSSDDNEEEEEEEVLVRRGSAGGAWLLSTPLGDVSRAISTSSPCIIDQPMPPSEASSSSERKLPQIYIQDVKGEMRPPDEPSPDRNAQKDRRYSQPAGVQPEPRRGLDQSQKAGLSSSHISVFSQSSDAGVPSNDWPPPGSPTGPRRNSSYEDLLDRTGGSKIQEVLQRAQRTKLESETHHADSKTSVPWHHSTGHLHDDQESPAHLSPFHHSTGNLCDDQPRARALPWHLSTGDLYDHEETESSDGSTSSPPLRQRPGVARRLSSQLRNRMCRSLGADLDQLLQEEARGEAGGGNEAARLNRLHMISSSLSLRYNLSSSSLSSCSTPPRCHSLADLAEGVEGKRGRRSVSTAHPEGSSRQSVVPLEAREHAWLVKGAAGAWPDIYSLFREDSTLLNRRDFISGFTVLHWIAKHGDHRVLNTLWYGVQKAGLTFDINARSTCGHTPLHIAAMHGHKNIMRLLVNKFNADVKLRDTAGKKPWQYLGCTTSVDVFQLLGAPPQAAVRAEGGVGRADSTRRPDPHQRRRQRHHFSSASGERPLTIAGTVRVKRSSSLAAFLKHKSMRRFHGHQSESSM